MKKLRRKSRSVPYRRIAVPETDHAAARLRMLQADAAKAIRRYDTLMDRVAVEDRMVHQFREQLDELFAGQKLTIQIPEYKPAPKKSKSTPEDAVLVISDSHIWKIVTPEQTQGFGHYNPKVFLERAHYLEQTVCRLLTENVANPVRRLWVPFLGDLVEGGLQHSAEMPLRGVIADQVILATWTYHQMLARLASVVPEVVVLGVGGNHARWMNLKRVPTDNHYSNIDYIVLSQLEALTHFAGPKNVKFRLCESAFDTFNACGWNFKVGHGDHLKGGDRALGIPAHAIGREVSATAQRYDAKRAMIRHGFIAGEEGEVQSPDYYLVGDKHRHLSVSTSMGRYMINGAWFTDCPYALRENFTPSRPYQMFFGVHPRMGRSWSYDLHLDVAPSGPTPYQLPPRIAEKIADFT